MISYFVSMSAQSIQSAALHIVIFPIVVSVHRSFPAIQRKGFPHTRLPTPLSLIRKNNVPSPISDMWVDHYIITVKSSLKTIFLIIA